MGSELEQPFLSSPGPGEMMGPRILDRDGTFSQSRGRWSVSNTNSKSSQGIGSARQRRTTAATAAGASSANGADVPFGVASLPQRPPAAQPSFWDRLCCSSNGICCFKANDQPHLGRRCWDDWFHTLSYTPTCVLMLGVFAAYFVTIVIFAGLYLAVNKVGVYYGESDTIGGGSGGGIDFSIGVGSASDIDVPSFCGMDINNHMEALYFSLSTMATIGYGTSDYYFGECWTPFILVLLQVFSAIVFSSLAIGLLFQRMSRGQKRGRTIVFSDVAVIRKVRGRWYWMFRVAELRKRHIIGAKVRVFCVRHERCPTTVRGGEERANGSEGNGTVELETAYFVSHPLPLLNGYDPAATSSNISSQPANLVGSSLESSFEQSILMGLPHVVVHCMDSSSPMVPPEIWYDQGGVPHARGPTSPSSLSNTPRENSSAETAAEVTMPSSLLPAVNEGQQGPLSSSSHQPSNSSIPTLPTQEEITHFLQDRQVEIIVFLEGICEVTGMALQARHSYRMEDIAFHQTFAPCVLPSGLTTSVASGKKWWKSWEKSKAKVDYALNPSAGDVLYTFQGNAALEIDFSQFHDLQPAPYDSMSCPYITNFS